MSLYSNSKMSKWRKYLPAVLLFSATFLLRLNLFDTDIMTAFSTQSAEEKIGRYHHMSYAPICTSTHCGYSDINYVSNSTKDFLEHMYQQGDPSRKDYNPQVLLEGSRGLNVGEEFLHLGNHTSQLCLLGRKLSKRQAIKAVWFGGSNTNGRTSHPFTEQTSVFINTQYAASEGTNHTFVNRGIGGGSSCRFAKGFKSELFNLDVKGADLIFLEFAVNDGVLSVNEANSCFESLIIRIRRSSPGATIVALEIMNKPEHERIIRHYDMPLIHLGYVSNHFPYIYRLENGNIRIHLNDVGSFLVYQAIKQLLHDAVGIYNTFEVEGINGRLPVVASERNVPRLFEATESFDWVMNFDNSGGGKAIENIGYFKTIVRTRNVANRSVTLQHAGDIINAVSSLGHIDISIPCEDCPDPKNHLVEDLGGGWTLCASPWPAVCRNKGIHHNHCSNEYMTGIFLQSFMLDNLPTDEYPGNASRVVSLFIRLLKGYDQDFGQSLVIVWVDEVVPPTVAMTYIDTKWNAHATVMSDVKIAELYLIPAPDEHRTLNLTVAILPFIQSSNQSESPATLCRLNMHSVLGEFV